MRRVSIPIIVLLLLCGQRAAAQERPFVPQSPARVLTNDVYDSIGTSAFTMWFGNNGSMMHNPATDANGFEWPKGSGKHVGFNAGLVYGCMYKGELHAGGSTYRQGLQAGNIQFPGLPSDPSDSVHHIYVARRIGAAEYATLTGPEQQRLRADFMSWPANLGAPWIDRNRNGIYDPDFDRWLADSASSDGPLPLGDQLAWFVSNDMEASRTLNLYGTEPIGLEIQTLLWTWSTVPSLVNMVFVKHTLINKSRDSYDNMFIGRWGDPDIGSAVDDLAGCDTTRDLMYVYNGNRVDNVYGDPPAFGTVLLQGPIVRASEREAHWNFGLRVNAMNLRMSAFMFYVGGDAQYRDPQLGLASGSTQMYNSLRGRLYDGTAQLNPVTGRTSTYAHTGDPVTGRGWLDGKRFRMGDRRTVMGCGPFTMAPGDTQEVVFADIVAQGPTTARDILALRDAADAAHIRHAHPNIGIPDIAVRMRYPDANTAEVHMTGRMQGAAGTIPIVFRTGDGVLHNRGVLLDDGLHEDGAANDGVYGGSYSTTRAPFGLDCFVSVSTGQQNDPMEWPIARCLPLSGPMYITDVFVQSDHLNSDGHANPGENVRVGVTVGNQTSFTLDTLEILDDGFLPGTMPWMQLDTRLEPGRARTIAYNLHDSATFATVDVPGTFPVGERLPLPFLLRDGANQCWCDTARLLVEQPAEAPVDSLAIHAAGNAVGTLGWRITDRALLQDHTYRITIRESDPLLTRRTVTIFDMTAWRDVVVDAPFPDRYAHLMPSSDGWKLHAGTSTERRLYDYGSGPEVELVRRTSELDRWLIPATEIKTGIAWGWGSEVKWFQQRPMRIVFDPARTQKAHLYLRGGNPNYAYSGYHDVPFTVWDISDTLRPRQVNAAFVEQKGGLRQNNTWDPITQGDREYLFLFTSDYSGTPQDLYTRTPIFPNGAATFDLQYATWLWRDTAAGALPPGSSITVIPLVPVSSVDTFYVNPKGRVNGIETRTPDRRLDIGSLYPNPARVGAVVHLPVNSSTRSTLRISVYDALGRRAAAPTDATAQPGRTILAVPQTAHLRSGVYRIVIEDGAGAQRTIPFLVHQ